MIKTRAIVLSKKDLNDYDALVYFYSLDFGKITLMARGLKKSSAKLAGHLDGINLVELMIIKGRDCDYVGSAISENSFLSIKSNYDKVFLAGKALSFLKELTYPQQPDFNIFLLLKDFLFFLDRSINKKSLLSSFYFFKLKLLEFLGYDFSNPNDFDLRNNEMHSLSNISLETLELKNKILRKGLTDSDFCDISVNDEKEIEEFINTIKRIIF